jgi:hypothetical protein
MLFFMIPGADMKENPNLPTSFSPVLASMYRCHGWYSDV